MIFSKNKNQTCLPRESGDLASKPQKIPAYAGKALLLFLCTATLTGCITREQADARIARGCAAGVEIFLDEGFKIKEIKNKIFKDDAKLGAGYRHVTLKAIESDGWLDVDKDYQCIFVESFGFLNATHDTTIYQIQVNGQTYGQKDGKVLGDFKDHLKLTETVERAMGR